MTRSPCDYASSVKWTLCWHESILHSIFLSHTDESFKDETRVCGYIFEPLNSEFSWHACIILYPNINKIWVASNLQKKYSKVFLFQQKINLNSFLNPLHMSVVIHISVERILAKGQLISKGLFKVFICTKKMNKNIFVFLP